MAKSTLEKKIVKRYGLRSQSRRTSSMWKDTIREFTQCIFVLNFTNMTLIKSSSLCKERRSEN